MNTENAELALSKGDTVAVGVRLPSDLLKEVDELAYRQARAAGDVTRTSISVNRSRTLRALVSLGLQTLRQQEKG